MTTRALDLEKVKTMLKPRVRRARPGDYIYTVVTERRGIAPPWLTEYVVNGRTRVKAFQLWSDAIQFALTDC